ncbi:hypothetical protein [Desulfosporosinus fructosivorans]
MTCAPYKNACQSFRLSCTKAANSVEGNCTIRGGCIEEQELELVRNRPKITYFLEPRKKYSAKLVVSQRVLEPTRGGDEGEIYLAACGKTAKKNRELSR